MIGKVSQHHAILSILSVVLLLLSFHFEVRGQSATYAFDRLGLEQGLPSLAVFAMAQDSRGFVWFGTTEGLCRYDGYNVKVYDRTPLYAMSAILDDKQGSLWYTPSGELHRLDMTSGRVRQYKVGNRPKCLGLYPDTRGDFWVGTLGEGLAKYNRSNDSITIYKHQTGKAESLCNDTVWYVYEDSKKELWIGTSRGLERFNRETESFYHIDPLRSNCVQDVVEGSDHALWIATDNGLCQLDGSSGAFSRYTVPPGQRSTTLELVHEDRTGKVWVVGESCIGWLDKRTHRLELLRDPYLGTPLVPRWQISRILEDCKGDIWFSIDRGLAIVDGHGERCEIVVVNRSDPHGLPGSPEYLLEDDAENIWIATRHRGVCMLDRNRMQFQQTGKLGSNGAKLISAQAASILEDSSGTLWVGSVWGFYRFDPVTGNSRLYDLPGVSVDGLLEVRAGVLWLCTDNGLYQFETATEKITRLPPPPEPSHGRPVYESYTALMKDRSGRIWMGGGVGNGLLGMIDPSTGASARYFVDDDSSRFGLSAAPIWAIHEDSHGILWFTKDKIGVFDRQSGQARFFASHPDTPGSSRGGDGGPICESTDGTLWVATPDGLVRFNRSDSTFNHVGVEQGLPDTPVLKLLEDNSGGRGGKGKAGNLWLLTMKGITRYNPSTGAVSNYGPADGVNIIPVAFRHSCFKNRDGYLLFGGTNGFIRFHPDSVRDNTFVPPIVITSFKIFNAEAKLDSAVCEKKSIELSYAENVISIEFAALNYVRPEKNKYAYMLEGFDRDWVNSGARRSATYTNLSPGTYLFRVKGSNNDNLWNGSGTTLLITVTPPPWRTWWANSFYVLFAAGLLYSAFRFQHNRMILRHEVEVKAVEARKLKEVNEIKSRFFANISHEFRTPLTLILGSVENMLGDSRDEKANKWLGLTKRNAQGLLGLVDQLLDLSKLETGAENLHARKGNIVPVIKGVAYSFESSAILKRIELRVCTERHDIQIYFDRDKVEKILTNLIGNAFKFTPQGGRVEVSARLISVDPHSPESGKNEPARHQGGESLEIRVSDTGVGIGPEHLARIFDRFYQVDDSTTREHGGTGIGLALVKELVELHHGTISVASKPGEGTTFTVLLPSGNGHLKLEEMAEGQEEEPAEEMVVGTTPEPVEVAQNSGAPHVQNAGKNIILVVEDNADVREYINESLLNSYQVLEARDGVEGIEKAIETIPDLVISDVMMPRKDGYELCRRLKNDERTSHIPIILLTAKAASENRLEGLETGADDYLIKPFEPKELQVRIRNLIDLRKKLRDRFKTSVPLKPGEIAVSSMDDVFLKKVMAAVEQHMDQEHFHTDQLAEEVGVSRVQLHRKLTSLTNQSPGEFVRYLRLHRAMDLLQKKAGTVAEIAFSVGFSDHSHFSRCFHKQFGKSPTDVRNESTQRAT